MPATSVLTGKMRAGRMFGSLLFVLVVLQLAGCAAAGRLDVLDRERIAGKTYVITGASSGLGRGTALKLSSFGANVVLAARRTDLLNEVASQVKVVGGVPLVVTTDVSRPSPIATKHGAPFGRHGYLFERYGLSRHYGHRRDAVLRTSLDDTV